MKPLLSRKDIAQMLGDNVTERQVAYNERRWGLDRARVKLKTRRALYRAAIVGRILTEAGAI